MADPVHNTIVMLDVEGYSSVERTRDDLDALKKGLHEALVAAFADSGMPWDDLQHEINGDGYLILVPARFSKSPLVERFPQCFAKEIRVHNAQNEKQAQMRLRMALNAGEIAGGPGKWTSPAISRTARLIDDQAVKSALAGFNGVLVMITSDYIFDEVVRPSRVAAAPTFRKVRIKRISQHAWISRPEDPYPVKKRRSAAARRFWWLAAAVIVVAAIVLAALLILG
ncbi:hypothetical protein ACWEF6_15665 [Amycolatopsis sp. NPDC004772]